MGVLVVTELRKLTQVRGHEVYWDGAEYRFESDDIPIADDLYRACVHCELRPIEIKELGRVDACFVINARYLQEIGGREFSRNAVILPREVTWACCGHGVEEGYIRWGNDFEHSTDALLVDASLL